jgi:hypothetical protein
MRPHRDHTRAAFSDERGRYGPHPEPIGMVVGSFRFRAGTERGSEPGGLGSTKPSAAAVDAAKCCPRVVPVWSQNVAASQHDTVLAPCSAATPFPIRSSYDPWALPTSLGRGAVGTRGDAAASAFSSFVWASWRASGRGALEASA